MSSLQTVPLIFGVTGHMDLREDDIPKLKTTITSLFNDYRTNYPNTDIIVISALADGADMLVAKVAQELDISLHVALPYNKEDYISKSIDDKELFEELLIYAGDNVKTLDCQQDEHEKFTHCYQKLGEYIADKSNILIALWDGVEEAKNNGGTAAVVRHKRDEPGENMFDSKDGNAIVVIPTSRKKDVSKLKNSSTPSTEYLGRLNQKSFEENLSKFDLLNADILNYNDALRNIYISSTLAPLEQYKKFFGNKANTNQNQYKQLMSILLKLIVGAIIFLEIMHVFSGAEELKSWSSNLIVFYVVFLVLAFGIYRWKLKKGKLQDDFIYSRGFSEAIRVQSAWNVTGLHKSVSAYFLRGQPPKLTWMRMGLKNIHYIDNGHYESVAAWIRGQINYFEKGINAREAELVPREQAEKHLFYTGVIVAMIAFALYLLEWRHIIPHEHFPYNWHFLILVSGIALLFAGYTKKYLYIQGYKEDKNNFEEILPSFKKAAELLGIDLEDKNSHTVIEDKELLERVVFDLGKKALVENSQWVGLHDARRAKFEME